MPAAVSLSPCLILFSAATQRLRDLYLDYWLTLRESSMEGITRPTCVGQRQHGPSFKDHFDFVFKFLLYMFTVLICISLIAREFEFFHAY